MLTWPHEDFFAADEDTSNHAIQCADFALHVLNILDDINIKLNLSFTN